MTYTFSMIKELRLKTGLSQQDFADRFNIPVSTLRQWEQGRRKAPDYVFSLLTQVLQTSQSLQKPVTPANTWQQERKNRYIFPLVVEQQDFHAERIHPLNQKKAVAVYELLKEDPSVEEVYIFGSSTNLRCKSGSDIDVAIRLKPDSNNWTEKGRISEAVSAACGWNCDIIWLNDSDPKSQLYKGILEGEKII